jgi:hypothetical protein
MNNIFKIPAFQRRKAIPKQLKDLELLPLNEQFSKLTISIVGDDDLRPVMTGNFFDMEKKKIVSTDAHKLTAINMPNRTFDFIKQTYNKELDKDPKGLIFHTLSQLQNDYNKLMKNNNISISFDEFVKDRAIEDGKYPNYEAVFPKEFTNEIDIDYQKLYWYAKVLLDAKVIDDATKINTSNANEYQNKKIEYLKDSYVSFLPYTKQIILTYTLDGKQEYIGFNARLVCEILKFAMNFNGKTFGKVGISGNNRGMVVELENGLNVINDSVGLLMPVMLVSGQFDNTIGDSDFDLSVAMYYDLDTNSIISDKENYPINESIGFMPNKAGLSTPNIRVKEEVLKVENSSADLIDKKIRGLMIALKVAKQGTEKGDEKLIEKKIKGLEIAKRMKKDDLPFSKGGNIGFKGLSNKVASNYEGKKVPQRFQSIYGKTYSESEAQEVGNKVAGKVYREQQANKMADGGMVTYDINWEDENGDEYSESFDTIEEVNDLIKNIQKNGGRIIEKLKYIGDDFKGYFENGGGVIWDKDSDSIRTELGEFKVRITPQMQKGYYDVYVSANKKEIGKKYDVYGIDNAKDIALEIISNSNKFAKGGMVEYFDYKDVEIMYEPTYEEYFVNDLVFNTLEKAKKYIDSGEANETPTYIENLYRRGAMAKGGGVSSWNTLTIEKIGKNFPYKLNDLNKILQNAVGKRNAKIYDFSLDRQSNKYDTFAQFVYSASIILNDAGSDSVTPSGTYFSQKSLPIRFYLRLTIDKDGNNNPITINASKDVAGGMSIYKSIQVNSLYEIEKYINSILRDNPTNNLENMVYKDGGAVDGEMSFSASEQENWSKKKSFMYDLYVSHSNDLVDLKEYLKKAKNRKDTNEVKRLNIKKRNLEYSINYIKDKFSNYAKGGAVDGVYIDLFEDYENIPAEVQMILDEYSESFEDGDYIGMSKAQNELEQIGYTFDFYVDGDAYGLRPINVKLSQLQGYEDEDEDFDKGGGVLDYSKLDEEVNWYVERIKNGTMSTTKESLLEDIETNKKDLYLLEVNRKKPSDIIGKGYKGNTRLIAENWLKKQIYVNEKIISSLQNDNFYKAGGEVADEQVYIDYMNKEKDFKQDRIYFNTYAEAVEWGKKNFERFNNDMINYV